MKTRREDIRNIAKIVKNVVVFKGPTCVEIWAEEVWNAYFDDVDLTNVADAFNVLNNNG